MSRNKLHLIVVLFLIVGRDDSVDEPALRRAAERSDEPITREDVGQIREEWFPFPEWAQVEQELHRILRI
jgi:hypothetical protein